MSHGLIFCDACAWWGGRPRAWWADEQLRIEAELYRLDAEYANLQRRKRRAAWSAVLTCARDLILIAGLFWLRMPWSLAWAALAFGCIVYDVVVIWCDVRRKERDRRLRRDYALWCRSPPRSDYRDLGKPH